MRSLSLLLLAALLTAAACADEPASARRSLTFVDGLVPARPRSESDKRKCLENVVALGGACKHELLLASFFPDRLVPRACCRAADEVDDHCGPLTRAFFRAVLPRDLFRRCDRQPPIIRAPPTPIIRAPPPLATVPGVSGAPPTSPAALAPPLATVPSVSGGGAGARAPPAPEAQTSERLPPPRGARASGGTAYAGPPKVSGQQVSHPVAPAPKPHASAPRAPKVSGGVPRSPIAGPTSAYLPPPYAATVPRGKHATPPPPSKVVGSGTYAPVVSGGGPRAAVAPSSSSPVPGNEDAPKPKIISGGGSAGGRTRRAPAGVYGPATPGTPLAATALPPSSVPKPHASARHTPKVSGGVPPKVVGSGTYAPVVSGGSPRVSQAPRASAVPVNEDVPKPKVISAGGRTRRAPAGVYGPGTPGTPSAAATASAPPKKGAVDEKPPVVSGGGPRAAAAPRSSSPVPVNEDTPKPKVISAGGSAGGQARRAPAAGGVYGPATHGGAPLAAAASGPPKKGATENAGGSAGGQTRLAPAGGYGPATDAPSAGASSAASNYGERMGTLYPTILP